MGDGTNGTKLGRLAQQVARFWPIIGAVVLLLINAVELRFSVENLEDDVEGMNNVNQQIAVLNSKIEALEKDKDKLEAQVDELRISFFRSVPGTNVPGLSGVRP